jgi:AcrR family transcriptional regulator
MAAKKAAPKKSNTKSAKSSGSATPLERILDAGLDEVAAVGWRSLAMDAVAERAGLSLGEVLLQVPSKTHLMLNFLARVDQRTLSPVKRLNAEDSPRERLFEILMRRFDALNEKREAAKAVVTGVSRDPAALAAGLCRVDRSFAAMLSAAGISTGGLLGLARIQGLKAVAAYTLRAWMNDDSTDLSKTMAALDRALARAEKLASFTSFRKRAAAEEEPAA